MDSAGMYAPFSEDEAAGASTSRKPSTKTPIVPVPENAPEMNFKHPKLGLPSRSWPYRDSHSQLVGYVCRWDFPGGDGKPAKEILPVTFCDLGNGRTGWRSKGIPAPRPLYALPTILANPDSIVLVVEGEKTRDAARDLFREAVATTPAHGAKSPHLTDFLPLAGRIVIVLPDYDEPGRKDDKGRPLHPGRDFADEVIELAKGVGAAAVYRLAPEIFAPWKWVDGERVERGEPIPDGWDLADAIEEGWTAERVSAVLKDMADTIPADTAPFAETIESIGIEEMMRLGREARARIAGEETVAEEEASTETKPDLAYVSFGNFTMNSSGLVAEVTKGRGENATLEEVWISAAFEVIGRARDPHGQGWARWLRWRDPDGRRHEHAVTDAALHGDLGVLAADLASRGLVVSRAGRGMLCDYLNRVSVDARVTTVNRTGWHIIGEHWVFVLPDVVIGQAAAETVILTNATAAPYARRGTLQEWGDGIGRLTAGHGLLMLAVSTALAGPLVHLIGGEGGGLNVFGQSSRGKTTMLKAAASVWGRGASDPGFVRSWRATANAQEATAAIVTDTLLPLDEIGVAEGRDAAAAVYQLASGVGKGRSARDGSIRTPMTWRVLTLSTGELPMAAKIAEDRQRRAYAGQAVRLLDIPADAGRGFGVFDNAGPDDDPARLAESIQKAATCSYGVAGPAFVQKLMDVGIEEASKLVVEIVENFVAEHTPADADGQIRRAAARLGMIAAAGELAISFGIVPWQEGDAETAAARSLASWIATRGGIEPAEIRAAISQVRRFFEAHGESRFEPTDDSDVKPVPNRAGWRRGHGDGGVWLVLPEMWKGEVCAGLDPVETARTLADRGMLRRDPKGKFQKPERTPAGLLRVYVVTAAVFDGGSDAV